MSHYDSSISTPSKINKNRFVSPYRNKNAEKAEENMWISWMVVAKSLGELEALVKSHGSTN